MLHVLIYSSLSESCVLLRVQHFNPLLRRPVHYGWYSGIIQGGDEMPLATLGSVANGGLRLVSRWTIDSLESDRVD